MTITYRLRAANVPLRLEYQIADQLATAFETTVDHTMPPPGRTAALTTHWLTTTTTPADDALQWCAWASQEWPGTRWMLQLAEVPF